MEVKISSLDDALKEESGERDIAGATHVATAHAAVVCATILSLVVGGAEAASGQDLRPPLAPSSAPATNAAPATNVTPSINATLGANATLQPNAPTPTSPNTLHFPAGALLGKRKSPAPYASEIQKQEIN